MAKILTSDERKAIETKATVNKVTIEKQVGDYIHADFQKHPEYAKADSGVKYEVSEIFPDKKHISYTGSAQMVKNLSKRLGLDVKAITAPTVTKNGKTDTRVVAFLVDQKKTK